MLSAPHVVWEGITGLTEHRLPLARGLAAHEGPPGLITPQSLSMWWPPELDGAISKSFPNANSEVLRSHHIPNATTASHQDWLLGPVQFSRSVVSNSLRPHGPQHARLPCLSQLPRFTQTHVHWVGDAIHCCPFLLLPSIFPSLRVFSNESVLCIRWPK